MCRVCMGRVCHVPSLLWAEFAELTRYLLMHRRIRSPARGQNTLYVFEPQQNLGRVFFFFNVKPV